MQGGSVMKKRKDDEEMNALAKRPVSQKSKAERIREAREKVMRKHGKALEKLSKN